MEYKYIVHISLFVILGISIRTNSHKNGVRRFVVGKHEIEIGRAHRYEVDFPASSTFDSQELLQLEDDNAFKRSVCPNVPADEDIHYYRVDKKSKKCSSVLLGQRGHCGPNMLYYEKPNTRVYGNCDCEHEGKRVLIYHEETFTCYPMFQQAYCEPGKWLILERPMGIPRCKTNPCFGNPASDNSLDVEVNGNCAQLGRRSSECAQNEIVSFVSGKILPRCVVGNESFDESEEDIQPGGQGMLFKPVNSPPPCAPGSKRSLSGRCQSNWTW